MYRRSWRERASKGARNDASWTEDREKRWWNDEGENEREERAKVGARVYKLVIWGTGHVRGSRSLRRRNKSATYDPSSFSFVSAATSSYHFSSSFSFTFFFSRTSPASPSRSSCKTAVIYSRITVAYNKPLFILQRRDSHGTHDGTDFPVI